MCNPSPPELSLLQELLTGWHGLVLLIEVERLLICADGIRSQIDEVHVFVKDTYQRTS